jgi:pimeloyl-ACP methyl ester carboxylesterase
MLTTEREILPDGRALRVARLGVRGGVPVVLLHGYPDNLQLWSRLAPLLARRQDVIAFDWPGMGDSAVWPGGTTPQHQAERLIALLDRWCIAQADVVGMDMGGQPALVAAALHPARIRRLTVMNSLVLWDERTSWEIALLRRYGWNRWLLRNLPYAVFHRAVRTSLPLGTSLPTALRDDLWRGFARPEVRAFIIKLCVGYQASLPRLPEVYRQIRCPTTIIWGARDSHFPPRHGERLRALIPGATYTTIAGGEHWMVWHAAEAVAAAITAQGSTQ